MKWNNIKLVVSAVLLLAGCLMLVVACGIKVSDLVKKDESLSTVLGPGDEAPVRLSPSIKEREARAQRWGDVRYGSNIFPVRVENACKY